MRRRPGESARRIIDHCGVERYLRPDEYNYAPATWQAAKDLVQQRIISNLRNPGVLLTTYGDLVRDVSYIIDFGTPRNAVFHCLLGQISDEQEEQGRGLLTALVVHKDDLHLGVGFFEGAANWGRDITDRERCWSEEIEKLRKIWT